MTGNKNLHASDRAKKQQPFEFHPIEQNSPLRVQSFDSSGHGNYLYFDNACSSIYNHLKMDRLILSFDKLETIVNIMFDIMENTPGMILDDSDVVIPRKH